MDSAQIGGIVRALVAAVGGYFVGQGLGADGLLGRSVAYGCRACNAFRLPG